MQHLLTDTKCRRVNKHLEPGFVGVTQAPADISDAQIMQLHEAGVRAVRFNVQRGGSAALRDLTCLAHRIYALAGWHVELYVDAARFADLYTTLIQLPAVSIDHLGLSKRGLPVLVRLTERGVRVKPAVLAAWILLLHLCCRIYLLPIPPRSCSAPIYPALARRARIRLRILIWWWSVWARMRHARC